MKNGINEQELRSKLAQYSFYHTIQLTETLATPGIDYPNEALAMRALRSTDVRGRRVLDIGCRDGKFAFEAEKLGAAEVIAIDNDLSPAAVEFLIPFFESKIKMVESNLFDVTPEIFGQFDIILFFGVLYHLRYPFHALRLVRDLLAPQGHLLIETATLQDANQHALLYCPVAAESPYEDTSCTFFNEKGLVDTLSSLGVMVDQIDRLYRPAIGIDGSGWKARLRRVRAAFSGRVPAMTIGRAVFVCRSAPQLADPEVLRYWDAIHTLETPAKRDIAWQSARERDQV